MNEMTQDALMRYIMLIVTITLSLVIIAMVGTLMIGLFNDKVDNNEIFKIITPAFSTVIGAFVGLMGGLSIGGTDKNSGKKEAAAEPTVEPAKV